ncbi:hypothetical protein [Sphingomonas phyllosphaerae]|nr:hypothetical protein [Sphingomonas phyllosphaerae]
MLLAVLIFVAKITLIIWQPTLAVPVLLTTLAALALRMGIA